MQILRTPDDRFVDLPDFPFEPNYAEIAAVPGDPEAGTLRVHYLDEGPRDAAPVLLMHGEPSWSFLYRHMIPSLVAAGHRVVAPDLVGFGRSDKPAETTDYTYARHVAWMSELLFGHLDLAGITFFGQDWGGLVGSFSVVNPRGIRAYIRSDVFFRAIPLVLEQQPQAKFYCPAMAGEPQAERWVRELGIESRTVLMPHQTRQDMANLFRQASIVVSPSVHDGTPNTLLEAMACGCFPVVGDLESLREWIVPNENGILVDANDPLALASAILKGLGDPGLREQASRLNTEIIAERADYQVVMDKVRRFYETLLN